MFTLKSCALDDPFMKCDTDKINDKFRQSCEACASKLLSGFVI